jgi:hypothetical protein
MRTIICAALALCLLACGKDEPAPGETRHAQQVAHDEAFEFNAEEFAQAFNAAAKTCGQPYRIGNVEIRHGALHDYFQQVFSDDLSLTVGVSKDNGRITSITALASGRNGKPDTDAMLAIAEIVALATNPRMSRDMAAAMVADMMQESRAEHESGHFPQRFFHHVRYVLRTDNGIGYWWIANPA